MRPAEPALPPKRDIDDRFRIDDHAVAAHFTFETYLFLARALREAARVLVRRFAVSRARARRRRGRAMPLAAL
jgi:hypothetical protein